MFLRLFPHAHALLRSALRPTATPLIASHCPAVLATSLPAPSFLGWLGGLLPGPSLGALFDHILWNRVPKKKKSYTRKRIRQAGQLVMKGPKLKPHLYMCPVCERIRAPHLVCEREDCKTYFRNRWF